MPDFQLLLGKNSKLKEIIPGGVVGGTEGQAREEEKFRKTIGRREVVPTPNFNKPKQSSLPAYHSMGLHGETHWTLDQLLHSLLTSRLPWLLSFFSKKTVVHNQVCHSTIISSFSDFSGCISFFLHCYIMRFLRSEPVSSLFT